MLQYNQREGETLQKKGATNMKKYYGAIISRYTDRAVCGKYFNDKADAIAYAKPSCGYAGSVVTYENGSLVSIEEVE